MRQRAGLRRRRNLAVATILRLAFRRLSALSAICPACRPCVVLARSAKPAQDPCLADQLCRVIRRQRWSGVARASRHPVQPPRQFLAQRVDARGDRLPAIVVGRYSGTAIGRALLAQRLQDRAAPASGSSACGHRARVRPARRSRADSRVSISRTWRSAVRSRRLTSETSSAFSARPPLADDLTPSRNRIHALAVLPERHAVETGIERAERHLAMREDARDGEAFRIHLARPDHAGAVERRIGFGADVR